MPRQAVRIADIRERDFWGSWSTRAPALREAVRLGLSGRRSAAYLRLAEHHRATTVPEWEHVVREAAERCRPPAAKRLAFSAASDLRKGRIRLWHDLTLDAGTRIDFDPDLGPSGYYGLHYLYWLTPLVDRHLLERDPEDLARALDIVGQYYAQRLDVRRPIPNLDPVYYELGAFAKTRALIPAYLAMIHAGRPTPRAMEAFLKLFVGFGRSLLELQKAGYRDGNWQMAGCLALFRLGTLLEDHREAPRWRRRCLDLMDLHIGRDFYADGGHKERNCHYTWGAIDSLGRCLEAAERHGHASPGDRLRYRRAIRRSFRWLVRMATPIGVMPAHGDSVLEPADGILSAARSALPEHEVRELGSASAFLPASGYAVMRDDGSRASRYLVVNFGERGGNHSHQDLLDFNLWAFGRPLIEELGRFGSYDEPLTPTFSSPPAHNQVVIDGHAMLRDRTAGQGIRWHGGRRIDLFSGWHDAFEDGPPCAGTERGRVRIHRHILFVRRAYWLVYDVVEPASTAIYTISSYLHSPRPFRIVAPGLARTAGRIACAVAFADPGSLRRLETGTDFRRSEVTGACMYPERHSLRARIWGPVGFSGRHRFAMLLYPHEGRLPRLSIRRLAVDGEAPGVLEAFGIRTPFGEDRVVLNPGGKAFRLGRLEGRACAAWSRGNLSESAG